MPIKFEHLMSEKEYTELCNLAGKAKINRLITQTLDFWETTPLTETCFIVGFLERLTAEVFRDVLTNDDEQWIMEALDNGSDEMIEIFKIRTESEMKERKTKEKEIETEVGPRKNYNAFMSDTEYKFLCKQVGKKIIDAVVLKSLSIMEDTVGFELSAVVPMLMRIIGQMYEKDAMIKCKKKEGEDENEEVKKIYAAADIILTSFCWAGEYLKKHNQEIKEQAKEDNKNTTWN